MYLNTILVSQWCQGTSKFEASAPWGNFIEGDVVKPIVPIVVNPGEIVSRSINFTTKDNTILPDSFDHWTGCLSLNSAVLDYEIPSSGIPVFVIIPYSDQRVQKITFDKNKDTKLFNEVKDLEVELYARIVRDGSNKAIQKNEYFMFDKSVHQLSMR
jgi:hypothetical protein